MGGDETRRPANADPDPGAFIGRQDELTRGEVPDTASTDDTNPDAGWSEPPAGHREADPATDDDVRRKG